MQVHVRDNSGADDVVALVNQRLPQELLDVLHVLLVDDFGQHSQRVGFEDIVLRDLHILRQTADDYEYFVLVDVELLDEDVDQSPQVLVELVPLRLRDLEELRDVEEQLTLLVLGEDLALIEQENHLVQQVDALLLPKLLVVEDVRLLDEGRLREIRVRVLVLARVVVMRSVVMTGGGMAVAVGLPEYASSSVFFHDRKNI